MFSTPFLLINMLSDNHFPNTDMQPRQEHVLHSIGQLFSSASDAANDDTDEQFDNEVDRAAVVAGGDDDEGNLDLSNPLRVVHWFQP